MKELEKWMSINATFSAFNGLSMFLFNDQIQALLGFQQSSVLLIIGAGLVVFSIGILYVITKRLGNKQLVHTISLLDGFWVLGSLLIVIFQLFDLSPIGYGIISVIAIIVGLFGYQQYRHNRKLTLAKN